MRIGGRHSSGAERLQRQVRRHRLHQAVGALAVGLVDDEDVGDLHDAGLDRLHVVAGAGHEHDDRDVRRADDVHFVLADADGLDDDDVLARGVEDQRRVARRARQAAEMAARRHAADEHAGIAGVRAHADAVAEDGAAGERAGRIDGDDADRQAGSGGSSAISRSTSVLLPAPGAPVTPTRYARARCCAIELADQRGARRRSSSTSEIARAIARGSPAEHALGERSGVCGHRLVAAPHLQASS